MSSFPDDIVQRIEKVLAKPLKKPVTIASFDSEVWQEIFESQRDPNNCGGCDTCSMAFGNLDGKDWARKCYEAWLTGGYPAAEEYLNTILPKV